MKNATDVTLQLYEGSDTTNLLTSWSVSASGSQSYQEKHASPKTFTAKLVADNGSETVTEERSVEA